MCGLKPPTYVSHGVPSGTPAARAALATAAGSPSGRKAAAGASTATRILPSSTRSTRASSLLAYSDTVRTIRACRSAMWTLIRQRRRSLRVGRVCSGKRSAMASWTAITARWPGGTGKKVYTDGEKKTSGRMLHNARVNRSMSRMARLPPVTAASVGARRWGTGSRTTLGASRSKTLPDLGSRRKTNSSSGAPATMAPRSSLA